MTRQILKGVKFVTVDDKQVPYTDVVTFYVDQRDGSWVVMTDVPACQVMALLTDAVECFGEYMDGMKKEVSPDASPEEGGPDDLSGVIMLPAPVKEYL